MDRQKVSRTEAFVKNCFDNGAYFSTHPAAKTYRLEHTYRVANIARQIARREGFDETEMVIAGLLHDISYCESFGEDGWKEHGRRSAAIAGPFLRELGLAEERVRDICFGIAIHVDDKAGFAGERTPFALSVGDADNIDRIDVYRLHETLCREGFLEKSGGERRALAAARLEKLGRLREMPMGTQTAAELWQDRLAFSVEFYERLSAQLAQSEAVL